MPVEGKGTLSSTWILTKKVEHSNASPYFWPTNSAERKRGMGAILKVSHGYSCHGNHFLLWGFQISEPSFDRSLKKNKGRTQTGTAPLFKVLKGSNWDGGRMGAGTRNTDNLRRLHPSRPAQGKINPSCFLDLVLDRYRLIF